MDTFTYETDNSPKEILLRKWRDALAISGGVVIILSLWDCLKFFIGIFLGEESLKKMISTGMKEMTYSNDSERLVARFVIMVTLLGIFVLITTIIFLFHYYIGINAWRAGRQTAKRVSRGYLVVATISMIISGALIIVNITSIFFPQGPDTHVEISTLLMELAALVNYLLMIYAAVQIKKLEQIGEGAYDSFAKV